MSYKKPFRVYNHFLPANLPARTQRANGLVTCLNETKDGYELRINLPDIEQEFNILINRGILYLTSGKTKIGVFPNNIIMKFLLPATIAQKKIKAYRRTYGIKVVLPFLPYDCNAIKVPLV